MKIGIISDTHDHVERIKKTIEILNKEKISMAYHLGDICSPFVLPLFKNLECDIKIVFGNNDADIFKIVKIISQELVQLRCSRAPPLYCDFGVA